jgi:ornithine cyclodeaminase
MMGYQILTDEDINRLLDMKTIIGIIEESFLQKSLGNFSHPPRIYVKGGQGALVFTVGASPNQGQGFGFRVYSMFKDATIPTEQLVAVFDSENGAFKGAVIGTAIGEKRTGAIGGVAIKYLARTDAKVLGLIGTGIQATAQLQAAVEVREFENILVYSRRPEVRERFAQRMTSELDREILARKTSREVVEQADVLICATTSSEPIFDPVWLKPGVHVTTLGPRFVHSHELPLEVALKSDLVVTDSVEQIEDFGERYFLHSLIPQSRYISLSEIVAGKHPGRIDNKQQTMFCSLGLAGTEVAVAAQALILTKEVKDTSG